MRPEMGKRTLSPMISHRNKVESPQHTPSFRNSVIAAIRNGWSHDSLAAHVTDDLCGSERMGNPDAIGTL